MTKYRDSNASFMAPLVAPVAMFLVLFFTGTSALSSGFTALFTTLISYFGFVIFILPLDKYLKAKRKEHMLSLLFSGLIGGALIVSVLYYLLGIVLGSREDVQLQAPAIGAAFGGLVAFSFCLLSGNTKFLPTANFEFE